MHPPQKRRIAELLQVLSEAQQELEALTRTQADGLGGSGNQAELLPAETPEPTRDGESALRAIAEMQLGILNSLPAHIALLDSTGVILTVNEAWRRFASASVLLSADFCIGQNYLHVCEAVTGECADESAAVAQGIRDVLSGSKEIFVLEYPCHSPEEKRWFRLMVTPLSSRPGSGAVVMHVNVTDRRLSEEALKARELEQRLLASSLRDETRRLQESQAVAKVGSWETDLATLQEKWSNEAFRIFERDPAHFLPNRPDFLKIVHPDDRSRVDDAFRKSLDQDGTFSIEHRICTPGDLVKHIEARWYVVRDSAGHPVRAVGTCQDVTARAQTLEQLQAHADRQASLTRLGTASTEATTLQAVLEMASREVAAALRTEFCKIVRRSPDGSYLRLVAGWGWEGDIQKVESVGADMLRSQASFTLRSGSPIVVNDIRQEKRFSPSPLNASHGVISGLSVPIVFNGQNWGVIGAHSRSVREFREEEIDFLQAVAGLLTLSIERFANQRRLDESRIRAQDVQRLAHLGSWELSIADGRLTWSDEIFPLFGIHKQEFAGSYEHFLEKVHPEDRESVHAAWQAALAQQGLMEIEHRIIWPDGEVRHLLTRGEVFRDGGERPAVFLGTTLDVTERVRSEYERDQFFNLSLDMLSVGHFDGWLERVNPAWTGCLGWTAAELTSRPWLDFVHPDDHEATIEAGLVLMQGQALFEFENRYRCKDGSFRRLSWNVQPLVESRKLFCVVRDVTEQRLTEDLLRRNEERFRLMIEGSEQVLFYTRDKEHRLTYASPSIASVLGYEPADVIGKSYDFLQIADDPINTSTKARIAQTLRDGLPVKPYPVAARHKDSRRVVLEIFESPFFENDNSAGFQGFARDLTERAREQHELALSEARFRSFFEQAAVGMVITSEIGQFLRVNQRFADIIGYGKEELVGNLIVQMTHPDDREHDAALIARLLGGQSDALAWEKRYLHKNGSAVWCKLSLSLLSLQEDGTRQFIGVVEDISEKKRSQEALERSQTMLRIAGHTAKLGGWMIDLPEMDLHWSDEVRAIHEVPPGFEPTLEQAIEYYPHEYRAEVSARVARCVEDGTPFTFEHELITATGRRIWVLAIGEAVQDARGSIIRVQGAFQDISARKAVEASLVASLRRFREIADTFPFIVWTAKPDGQVDYANRAFVTYIGLDQKVVDSAIDWTPYVHPDDVSHCLDVWARSIRTGKTYLVDFRIQQASSGDYHWHRVRAEPVRDDAGQIVKWYGSATDINETKTLEQQATALANRLNNTLESITDGFFILDADWTFTFLNTQAERLLNRARAELLGKNVWSEFPLVTGTIFEQQYRKAVNEGVSVHFQDYYPEPLNSWYEVSAYPSEGGLAIYFRDVTAARASQAQLRLLEAAVSRLNDIVLITEAEPLDDPGPRIVFVNEAFERRTGYTKAEVIGKSPRMLQGPKTQRAELDRIGQALRKWHPVRAELINYTKDGQEFWLELDIVPIADSKGWFTHWVAVERDISERKLAQQAILQLNNELEGRVQLRTQQLEMANKELEAFSYSVSHDLRSPLAVINGFGQLLLKSDGDQLSDKGKHYLRRIHAGSTKMGELIDGLLSLAKISRGTLNRVDVDLTAMSLKLVQELRDSEPDRVVDIDVQTGLTINGDPAMLTVVMQNLIANAWKYSANTPHACVEIGCETDEDGVRCMFVRDNGAGFEMAHAAKLFEVFQRLHKDSEFTGTGIGLANVKRVVERHGGRVWAQAAPGKGATFRFTLGDGR